MAKAKASKTVGQDQASPSGGLVGRILLHLFVAGVLFAAAGWGYYRVRQHVEKELAFPATVPAVVLKNRPAWMSDSVAEQITNAARPTGTPSVFDGKLLEGIAAGLKGNPWIKQVRQVRRAYGQSAGDTIEIDCEYRVPVALVLCGRELILVDTDGVRLPEKYPSSGVPPIMYSADGRMNIRIIDGVKAPAPKNVGQLWAGEDLQAGIDLAKFLHDQPVVEDVHRVDVSNFAWRTSKKDPQIVLFTRHGTRVFWGKPIRAAFGELPPVQKLERLAKVQQQFGRIDGGRAWIDIRFEDVLMPPEESSVAGGQQ